MNAQQLQQPQNSGLLMSRFDSGALFSFLKAEDDASNLFDFDNLDSFLPYGDGLQAVAEAPVPRVLPVITTATMPETNFSPAGIPAHDGSGSGNWTQHHQPSFSGERVSSSDAAAAANNAAGAHSSGAQHTSGDFTSLLTSQAAPQPYVKSGSGRSSIPDPSGVTAGDESEDVGHTGGGGSGRPKKKRTRNGQQMEMNRVAQAKYRERKKAEYEQLQSAVDQLTAQLAAIKALEARNAELTSAAQGLSATVASQSLVIDDLQGQLVNKTSELSLAHSQLASAAALAGSQQKLLLDQKARLALQEQIIVALKDRLRTSIDEALGNVGISTVCEKLVSSVKSTLYGAKGVDGLQDALESLPDHLVVEICKSILHTCKKMWPDLEEKLRSAGCTNSEGHAAGMLPRTCGEAQRLAGPSVQC